MARDGLFLRGFPLEVEGKIRHHLLVVKSDFHPDNPYLIVDTNNVAKFLVTGSAFRTSFQSPLPTPATSAPPQHPYHQAINLHNRLISHQCISHQVLNSRLRK
jgi:hypothetical protein